MLRGLNGTPGFFFQSFPIFLLVIIKSYNLCFFHKFPLDFTQQFVGCFGVWDCMKKKLGEALKDTHVWTVFQCDEALPPRGKFCVNHWQPVFDHVNHGFHDNMVAPRKTNMDTQGDGLEKVTPKRNGNCWYQFVRFLGCKFCVNHGFQKKNMVKTWQPCQPLARLIYKFNIKRTKNIQ